MIRRLTPGLFLLALTLSGCSDSGPPPDPEAPIKKMLETVEQFVGLFEELNRKALKETPPKEVETTLKDLGTKLDKMEAPLIEATNNLKSSPLTKIERDVHNKKKEYQERLEKLEIALRKAVVGTADRLNHWEMVHQNNEPLMREIGRFRASWRKLQEKGAELDKQISEWSNPKKS